jgi:hypothetical protein
MREVGEMREMREKELLQLRHGWYLGIKRYSGKW